ncbi:MAG: acyltransferase [Desulforhabdus sp.]|jgi:1-acyl-sn-glycerol-3-phosphate acyltransferase|nr:acyltransferase [Desulforhabdus sp.]
MLSFLPGCILGITCLGLVAADTLFWALPLHVLAFSKLLIPFQGWQIRCARYTMKVVRAWIWGVLVSLKIGLKINWDVKGLSGVKQNEWYFLNSNHQSSTDIVVLLKTLGTKLPFPKFFLKKELAWIPILGTAFWALDYPFMKRYSKRYLAKNPDKKGKDLETTKKMCKRYLHTPVTILNFIEGTRFSPKKKRMQDSPYRHLLKPKAGGFAFALNAMDGKIRKLLDVTIVYPEGPIRFWDFLCGRVSHIIVRVKEHVIPERFLHGNYPDDPEFREAFQAWVRGLWLEKDMLIDELLNKGKDIADSSQDQARTCGSG